jgi:hypothetical protein
MLRAGEREFWWGVGEGVGVGVTGKQERCNGKKGTWHRFPPSHCQFVFLSFILSFVHKKGKGFSFIRQRKKSGKREITAVKQGVVEDGREGQDEH